MKTTSGVTVHVGRQIGRDRILDHRLSSRGHGCARRRFTDNRQCQPVRSALLRVASLEHLFQLQLKVGEQVRFGNEAPRPSGCDQCRGAGIT
jgi:hypothetical protein